MSERKKCKYCGILSKPETHDDMGCDTCRETRKGIRELQTLVNLPTTISLDPKSVGIAVGLLSGQSIEDAFSGVGMKLSGMKPAQDKVIAAMVSIGSPAKVSEIFRAMHGSIEINKKSMSKYMSIRAALQRAKNKGVLKFNKKGKTWEIINQDKNESQDDFVFDILDLQE